jgi:ligand-binding sensor domain-containing protein
MSSNTILLVGLLTALTSCHGQTQTSPDTFTGQPAALSPCDTAMALGKNIDFIFQDKNDHYWFASNGEGVFRYDGTSITHMTEKDGLCSNFVWKIQEDPKGHLWFETRDGICSFDGKTFTDHTEAIKHAFYGNLIYTKGGLFFSHLNGVCFYDGTTFTNFTIHPPTYSPEPFSNNHPYRVYCTLVDRSGNVWFGTQEKGVCVYDGSTFSFIDGQDLGGPAVRAILQDKNGNLWFGNNGGGLYRYDGTTLRHITAEKNLGNDEFLKGRKPFNKPGSLARVFALNEDQEGNIWIGTVDAGVWKYDGTDLTNYTGKDGFPGTIALVIFKDKKGKLWFSSEEATVFQFDGQKFSKALCHIP